MTLEEKCKEYQKILVDEYREGHKEETEGLTDEEVALMNPLSDFEFIVLIGNELTSINKEIVEIMQDIKYTEARMNEPNVHYQEVTECRTDIVNDNRRLQVLRNKYDSLKRILLERENKDERSR